MTSISNLKTQLLPHQERVVRRMLRTDQAGLVVAHGLGSGKTLTSIAVQEALGADADVVVPASLVANYEKELRKHAPGSRLQRKVWSMQQLSRSKAPLERPLLIIDEGHRARNGGSATAHALMRSASLDYSGRQKRLVLTASPFYNHPADLGELVNIAAGHHLAYDEKEAWDLFYVEEEEVSPSLWRRFLGGARPGVVRRLRQGEDLDRLRELLSTYVDHHPNSAAGFPRVRRTEVLVPFSEEQQREHDRLRNQAPGWLTSLLDSGLAPRRGDAKDLNAFLSRSRQVCDSLDGRSPKVEEAVRRLLTCLSSSPRAKALVYSSFLGSCLDVVEAELRRLGVAHARFTGEEPRAERKSTVERFNRGELRVMLASSAAGEGQDLVGCRLVQVLEPAWNRERVAQVEGRAVRYMSHAHLPPAEQEVEVQDYTMVDRDAGRKTLTTDQYLRKMSRDKDELIEQFRALLPEAP